MRTQVACEASEMWLVLLLWLLLLLLLILAVYLTWARHLPPQLHPVRIEQLERKQVRICERIESSAILGTHASRCSIVPIERRIEIFLQHRQRRRDRNRFRQRSPLWHDCCVYRRDPT